MLGDKVITESHVKSSTCFKSISEFSKAIASGKVRYSELADVKPVLRLAPPRKGHGGIKRAFRVGGALGYRGEEINELLMRMI